MADAPELKPTLTWKGPAGWLSPDGQGGAEQPVVTLIVDETERAVVEYGRFALDEATLFRLIALVDSGAAVELVDRPPFVRADPTPAEMAAILDRADELRETLGDKAAQEYVEAATQGADI